MPNRPPTALVRIPVDLKEKLEKLKEEKKFKTLGAALEYWLKQATNENIERKFSKINERIERKFSAIEKRQKRIMDVVDTILDELTKKYPPRRQRWQEITNLKEK